MCGEEACVYRKSVPDGKEYVTLYWALEVFYLLSHKRKQVLYKWKEKCGLKCGMGCF